MKIHLSKTYGPTLIGVACTRNAHTKGRIANQGEFAALVEADNPAVCKRCRSMFGETPDKCGSPGPGELFCEREAGHDRQCAAKCVDELLTALTTDIYLGTAWALFLGRETPDGSSAITDVREISRARRNLVRAVDDLARKTCDAFIAAMRDEDDVPGSITPDPASPPADEQIPGN